MLQLLNCICWLPFVDPLSRQGWFLFSCTYIYETMINLEFEHTNLASTGLRTRTGEKESGGLRRYQIPRKLC